MGWVGLRKRLTRHPRAFFSRPRLFSTIDTKDRYPVAEGLRRCEHGTRKRPARSRRRPAARAPIRTRPEAATFCAKGRSLEGPDGNTTDSFKTKKQSPAPSSPSERSERVGLYRILDSVKVTVFGDPEEEAVQGKGPIKGPLSDGDTRGVTLALRNRNRHGRDSCPATKPLPGAEGRRASSAAWGGRQTSID